MCAQPLEWTPAPPAERMKLCWLPRPATQRRASTRRVNAYRGANLPLMHRLQLRCPAADGVCVGQRHATAVRLRRCTPQPSTTYPFPPFPLRAASLHSFAVRGKIGRARVRQEAGTSAEGLRVVGRASRLRVRRAPEEIHHHGGTQPWALPRLLQSFPSHTTAVGASGEA